MEPVTHFLTGACIGRAGLNRKTAYATLAAVLAAEAADIDVLWGLAGPVEELKHHRGITHTFLGAPFVAAAAVGAVWLFDRWLRARQRRALSRRGETEARFSFVDLIYGLKPVPSAKLARASFDASPGPAPAAKGPEAGQAVRPRQEIRWGWLYLTALIAALSHLLLDWTNNYGVRPFYPFNPRWYAGSLVFIAEPVLWVLLLAALIFPWLFGLTDAEIGAKKKKFRGRGWAIFALVAMAVLWGWRWSEQGRARMLLANAPITTAQIERVAFEPYPINPFRWHAIVETPTYYQTAEINTLTGEILSDPQTDVIYKPPVTAAVRAAKRTLLGRVYMDWGRWAVVRDIGPVPVPGMAPPKLPPQRSWTTVHFTDLRFDYSYLGAGRTLNGSPLDGWVYIVDGRDDAGESMNGREEH